MAKKTTQRRLNLIVLILIFAAIVFLARKFFFFKPVEKIPLPKNEQIGGYIQSLLVDLDKDEKKEAVAIYYDRGDEENFINDTFFVIFKLKNNQWTKLTETKLGYITFVQDKEFPSGVDKALNKFSLLDLTNDGYPDVLVESKIEGSGGYLTAYIYGLRNGKLEQLWMVESITKGKVGIDGDKVWLIMPNYGPKDPNCCPFEWVKSWWQWQQDDFKMIAELREPDLQELQAIVFRDEFRK
ncbi:MAG TPA: hypothetical protein VMW29_00185 [Candidatus Bathyarchaeia archaeon]|nr:hypothetical protein [Candidatus Bathyarchaeia archaeon]